MKKTINIQEKIVPVSTTQNGKPGFVYKDTETGKTVTGFVEVSKLTPDQTKEISKYTQPGGSQGYKLDPGALKSTKPAAAPDKTKPAAAPDKPKPAAAPDKPKPTPPAAPAPTRQSTPPAAPAAAPKPSPVAQYMAAASAARKIQDPIQRAAEMEKVKQSGLEIWAKSNPKLAAAADERARTRGTSATTNPLMADMKDRLPAPKPTQPETDAFARSRQTAQAMGQAATARNLAGPSAAPTATPDLNVSNPAKVPPKKPVIKASYEYQPYDLVLEYLLSEGHADTVDEAHYVMMQMSSEHVQNIVEAQRVLAQKTINGVTVPGYVKVEKQGGFLGFGGQNVPVKGSFIPRQISSGSAARYNQAIDAKYGTGSNKDAMPAYRVQQRALNQGSSGYMRVRNPDEIPNTGAANRPTPQRAGDQNRALNLLRPDVPIKSTVSPTPDNLRDPEFRRSGGWTGDPNAGKTAPKPAPKSKITMTDAQFDKKYAWAMNPPKPKSTPNAPAPKLTAPKPAAKPATVAPAPAPKPQPPTIQSQNVTAGGVKYERRTPTSAELAASKAAGGGEAGIKAAVDVAKSNKVAASAPTPDMKPAEAPKKRESLASQVKELQGMRKAAEERNK